MTTDRRIEKLYPALTAAERVVLLVEDRKRGNDDDPMIRSTMPRDQEPEFGRLLRDVGIANAEIGMLLLALYRATQAEEWRWHWFEALVAHHNDLAILSARPGKRKALKVLRPPIDLAAKTADETLAGRAPQLLKGLRDAVVGIADQAYATRAILGDFSGELGGADPLRDEARQLLEETEERLARLITQLEVWVGPIERHEDRYLGEVSRLVEGARKRHEDVALGARVGGDAVPRQRRTNYIYFGD